MSDGIPTSMTIEFNLYGAPNSDDIVLSMSPRLESWDAKTAKSQIALAAYLDHVAELVRVRLNEIGDAPLAIDLRVGLPRSVSLTTGGYDLDNYLFPLARRLGAPRIASARASKSNGSVSTLRIGSAVRRHLNALEGWQYVSAETTVSTATAAWKRRIAQQVATVATPAPDGPLDVHLALAMSSRRSWASLWKPAIDALGAIVGVEDPLRPFSTRDDRIVSLALHRTVDDALRNEVRLGVWWRRAS
jgi:hypothetical protein